MASRAPRSDRAPGADHARVEAALGRAVSAQLAPLLPRQRWFGDKGRTITGVRLRDCGALGDRAWLVLVDVTFDEGLDETYAVPRSEEHTSELQSQSNLVCRLLLEKKK